MLKESLHFFEKATVHENSADAAQELIEVDVLFLSLVEQTEDPLQDFGWVFEAEHLSNLDEVETFDAR